MNLSQGVTEVQFTPEMYRQFLHMVESSAAASHPGTNTLKREATSVPEYDVVSVVFSVNVLLEWIAALNRCELRTTDDYIMHFSVASYVEGRLSTINVSISAPADVSAS